MAAEIIDGNAVAAKVREEVKREVEGMGRKPGLATILVGDDPASAVYVRMKREDSAEVGIESFHHEPGGDVEPGTLAELITSLNTDDRVDGILLQLPLPDHLDQDEFVGLIDPAKDVDGLTTANAGLLMHDRSEAIVPCTPAGVMRLLEETGVELTGARAVVIGRSILVGKPMAQLLLAANATVIFGASHKSIVHEDRRILVDAEPIGERRRSEVFDFHARAGAVTIDDFLSQQTCRIGETSRVWPANERHRHAGRSHSGTLRLLIELRVKRNHIGANDAAHFVLPLVCARFEDCGDRLALVAGCCGLHGAGRRLPPAQLHARFEKRQRGGIEEAMVELLARFFDERARRYGGASHRILLEKRQRLLFERCQRSIELLAARRFLRGSGIGQRIDERAVAQVPLRLRQVIHSAERAGRLRIRKAGLEHFLRTILRSLCERAMQHRVLVRPGAALERRAMLIPERFERSEIRHRFLVHGDEVENLRAYVRMAKTVQTKLRSARALRAAELLAQNAGQIPELGMNLHALESRECRADTGNLAIDERLSTGGVLLCPAPRRAEHDHEDDH
jgi:5,10-methylene-tetrahydrofolate dehydrogenase/methenyl tetrahydrofolate cyclohydrolase